MDFELSRNSIERNVILLRCIILGFGFLVFLVGLRLYSKVPDKSSRLLPLINPSRSLLQGTFKTRVWPWQDQFKRDF